MQHLVVLAILFQGASALVLSAPEETTGNAEASGVPTKVEPNVQEETTRDAEASGVATGTSSEMGLDLHKPRSQNEKPKPRSQNEKTEEQAAQQAMEEVPWNDNTVPKPVFYTIIMGKRTLRHQGSLWYNALRKIGHWGGVAVIASDRPDCVAKSLTEHKLIGEQLSSSETVDIYGLATSAIGGKGYLHIVKRPVAEDIPTMKLERARAWLNMKQAKIPHPVSSIIYTDADVVIGENLALFYGQVRRLEHNKRNTLAVFRDTSKKSMGQLHTGVVVMFPGVAAEQCLQAWGDKITGKDVVKEEAKDDEPPLPVSPATDKTLLDSPAKKKKKKKAKFNAHDAQEEDTLDDADTSIIKEDQLLDEEIAAMGPDQLALDETLPCKKTEHHDGIRILPAKFLWLPTPKGIAPTVKHTAAFEHFTNDGRWQKIRHAEIMEYLWSIGVEESINPMGKLEDHQCLSGHSQ